MELARLTDEDLVNIEQIKTDREQARGSDSSNEEKTTTAESMPGMPKIQMTDELESKINYRARLSLSLKKSRINQDEGSDDVM